MNRDTLLLIYESLLHAFGPQHWWPADTPDEVVIGAVLTQNTAWINVERAIKNLKSAGLCCLSALHSADDEEIKGLIKPAGFFNQKCAYLKSVARFFVEHGGFASLGGFETEKLRGMLLSVRGVGRETADSILLYAFDRPVFVVDAYTKRVLKRHGFEGDTSYDGIQRLFMDNLKPDVSMFKEYHALLVRLGKEFCRPKPECRGCPLEGVL